MSTLVRRSFAPLRGAHALLVLPGWIIVTYMYVADAAKQSPATGIDITTCAEQCDM